MQLLQTSSQDIEVLQGFGSLTESYIVAKLRIYPPVPYIDLATFFFIVYFIALDEIKSDKSQSLYKGNNR